MTPTRTQRFEALAAAVAEPLRRYALRRTDAHTADDVLAEALLVCWRRLDDVPDPPLPWCYAVAANCLANAQRSARRQRALVARIRSIDPPAEVVDAVERPDPELHDALRVLRPDDQELLRLWAWEDLAPAEIAVVLGVTANAVSIRLHRARRRLADVLRNGEPSAGQIAEERGGTR